MAQSHRTVRYPDTLEHSHDLAADVLALHTNCDIVASRRVLCGLDLVWRRAVNSQFWPDISRRSARGISSCVAQSALCQRATGRLRVCKVAGPARANVCRLRIDVKAPVLCARHC